jgi:phage FluMu gp28-like protein
MKAKIIPADTRSVLLPYQAKWINDHSRLKLAEKSRQIGWTWATACGLVLRKCLNQSRYDCWISSRDELQAKLFVNDCKQFANSFHIAARDLGAHLIDDHGHSAYVLALANKLHINSMASTPNCHAGKRGDRILDEFALHTDSKQLYAIAYPGITWGGSLEIFSTHRGTHNYFNELIQEIKNNGNPKGFSLHSVNLQNALEQGLLYKLQQKLPPEDPRQEMDEADYFNFIKRGCPDEESFLQEYMCQPGDDATAFLPFEHITACEYNSNEEWATDLLRTKGYLFVGVDVGRVHDLTAIWVLEVQDQVHYTRRVITVENQPFHVQEQALYDVLRSPRVYKCLIDQTGIGIQFTERAKAKFGLKVEGVHFTAQIKEELAYPVRVAFESRTLRIPPDGQIRADLRAVRKETSMSGNARIGSERTRNGHSDRFWALALALHATKEYRDCGAMVANMKRF